MTYEPIIILYILVFLYLAYSDYRFNRIPNVVILSAIIIVTMLNCVVMPVGWVNTLVGGGIGLVCAILFVITGETGGGDLKLLLFAGLASGYPLAVVALPGSIIVTAIVGAVLKATKKKGWKDKLPLGVFLGTGTALTLVIGVFVL